MNCRFCETDTTEVLDLGNQPLANALLDSTNDREMTYPLKLYACENCGLLQVPNFAVPEEIFRDYAYHSSIGKSYVEQCKKFIDDSIERFRLHPGSNILEIACNDGYLLEHFKELGFYPVGVEPSNVAKIAMEKGIQVLNTFFDEELARGIPKQDFIIANNVLAHVPNLNGFVKGLKTCLAPQGIVSIEVPDLNNLIFKNQFDTVYHEHFSYFSIQTLKIIFAHHGLQIFDVESIPSHGGSLRVYLKHGELQLLEYESNFDFYDFKRAVKNRKFAMLSQLMEIKKLGSSIAAFGAAAKGNTFLNYLGIKSDVIDFVVDETPYKIGKFLPGSKIPVMHTHALKEFKPDYILILPWNFRAEIEQKLAFTKMWNARFL